MRRLSTLFALCLGAARAAIDPQNLQLALEEIQDLARQAVDPSAIHVPGLSIAIVYNGTIQYTGGFGVRDIGSNDSVDADTVFRLASMSKPIASTIVAAMMSGSNLTWDTKTNEPDSVAEYSDPWISAELTIADGFSHRSGLFGLAGDDLELAGLDRETILSRLQYMQPFGPFRASYSYSNYGLTSAAVSAARSINLDWEDAAAQFLYEPLSMNSTSSRYSDFLSRSNRVAQHNPASGVFLTNATNWTTTFPRNPDPQAPAGGVTSSATDLAKWLQLQLSLGINPVSNEQLIEQSSLNETRLPHVVRGLSPESNTTGFYGLGWNVDYDPSGRVYVDHAGAFSQGTRTQVKMNVEDGLGVVVLANCFPTGWPDGMVDYFFDVAYNGKNTTDWIAFWNEIFDSLSEAETTGAGEFEGEPMDQSSMLPASAYAGTYENDYVGVVEVAAGTTGGGNGTATANAGQGGDLVMSFPGSSNLSFPLTHWSRDTFILYPIPQEPDSGTAVTFMVGATGNATGVTMEVFSGNGGGVLMRNQG